MGTSFDYKTYFYVLVYKYIFSRYGVTRYIGNSLKGLFNI